MRTSWSFCIKDKETDNLNNMSHQRFQELVTVSKKGGAPKYVTTNICCSEVPQSSCLPSNPTVRGITLDAEEWGGKICEGTLVPIHFDLGLAPQSLLQLVRCTCKSGCGALRYGCRRNVLDCSPTVKLDNVYELFVGFLML